MKTIRYIYICFLFLVSCVSAKAEDSIQSITPIDSLIKDSIWKDSFDVREPQIYDVQQLDTTVCQLFLPYVWQGREYLESSEDTILVPYNKDSILRYSLRLKVVEYYEISKAFKLNLGDSVSYHQVTYSQPGFYHDTIHSLNNCDTVVNIVVQWAQNYHFYETRDLCEGSVITWRGREVSLPGDYADSLVSMSGNDSIYHLHVVMHNNFERFDTVRVCELQMPYQWDKNHKWYNKEGDATARFQTKYGCDSVWHLHLEILKEPEPTVYTYYFCDNEGETFRGGTKFYKRTVFVDTLPAQNGCDSLIIHEFMPLHSFFHETFAQHYTGDSYNWRGNTYTEDGVYYDSLISVVTGCDSVYQLRLVTKYDFSQTIDRCKGDTAMHHNRILDETIVIRDTLKTILGGDSIGTYTYNFHAPFYSREKITICSNDYFEWTGHNMTLHVPGIYYDHNRTSCGCDSTYEIEVKVQPAYLNDTLIIICNDSIDLHPFTWTDSKGYHEFHLHDVDTFFLDTLHHTLAEDRHYEPGEYYNDISGGCDSINSIHLIVTDRCSSVEMIPMCPGSTVWVDEREYDKVGLYHNHLPSSLGLNAQDSTHTFYIYEAPTYVDYDTIDICQSELPYRYHHTKLYKEGDYPVMLQTIYGCDSLVNVHLKVRPVKYTEVSYTVCPGTEFRLGSGKIYTERGTYLDTAKTVQGCDSVVRVTINYAPTYFYADTVYFAPTSPYKWKRNGQEVLLSKEGTYYDSCQTVLYGCDSIYRLTLIEGKPYYSFDTIAVCSNQLPLYWHDKEIWNAGTYVDTLFTIFNLDSVFELKVSIIPAFEERRVVNLCENDVFRIRDKVIADVDIYADTLYALNGCDSVTIYYFNRTVCTRHMETVPMAEGATYTWRGQNYTHEGYYYDTIRSQFLCDSIIYGLHLVVERPFLNESSQTICASQIPYEWRGRWLTESGVYDDSLTTHFGLDSIYRLTLEVYPVKFTSSTALLCPGDMLNFNARVIREPGTYYDTLYTTHGCDSVVCLVVNRAKTYYFEETRSFVNDSDLPISWHGQQLMEEGYYWDSLTTTDGCDSIYRVRVIKNRAYEFHETYSMCQNDEPYQWHGQTISQAGSYVAPYTTIAGLDSIYHLEFKVNPTYFHSSQISLCMGQTYPFYEQMISSPGVYRDTLTTLAGCDSIIELIVNYVPNSPVQVNHILCPGDTIYLLGQKITNSGLYTERLSSVMTGCDSVVNHIVTMGSNFFFDEQKSINLGESYTWHQCGSPIQLTDEGTYFDSCRTSLGCDSIYRLILKVNQAEYIFPTEQVSLCASELPYTWRGKTLMSTGLYYDSLRTRLGRDSVYSISFTVIPTSERNLYLDFCQGESMMLNGQIYSYNTAFTDTLQGAFGCDSIVHYVLNFNDRFQTTRMVDLRAGESYQFGDTVLKTPGVYSKHFQTIHGCDSLVTIHLKSCPLATESTQRINICQGDEIVINGQHITQSGAYYQNYTSMDGCDSLIRYLVNVYPSYYYSQSATLCKGDAYVWYGHHNDIVLTKQGIYYDSLKAKGAGCDSIYCLRLTYKKTDIRDTVVNICRSDLPYTYLGNKYFKDSVFYDTLPNNIAGCDSILRWNFRVNEHCSDYVQYSRCAGELTYIEGLLIDKAGSYTVPRLTQDGQDSLYRFTVRDVQPYERFSSISGCDSVVYNGRTYYTRGAGNEKFVVDLRHRSVEGCDSIEHVTMNIYASSPRHTHYETIADYQTIRFENETYKSPGTYLVRHTNRYGCDSIEELVLTVLTTSRPDPLVYSFCEGDRHGIEVFGRMYYPTSDTLVADTSRQGGQPTIRIANIYMRKPFRVTNFHDNANQEVCASNEVTFYVDYSTLDRGILPEYYDVDFFTGDLAAYPKHQTHPVGGKTTLPIIMDGQGRSVNPGYYSYRISLRSDACSQSDTSFTGTIVVRYPDDIMEANWNNMVALVNEKYNAGAWALCPPYQFEVISLEGDNKTARVTSSNPLQPYIYSNDLREGDVVTATLYRSNYSRPVPSCPFTFVPQLTNGNKPVLVYPTSVSRRMPVTVETTQTMEYRLIDALGHSCLSGRVDEGKHQVRMPAVAGCYLLQLTDAEGNSIQYKVMVY